MKFIDLFAGLGGFHIALKNHGMECAFACEIDKNLRELYKKNFDIECLGDITQIDEKDIPPHDILCAGFPCQPFSKAGKQKGLNDKERGRMIFEIKRILKFHQPKYFLLENVANLKTHDAGQTWKEIEKILVDCDYFIQDYILSPHHFGIPNNRERIFIIGIHNSIKEFELKFEKEKEVLINIKEYLKKINKEKSAKKIPKKMIDCLNLWQKDFIDKLPTNKPMPKFPVWSMEFGANYPLDGKAPYHLSQKDLEKCKGAFGLPLKGMSKKEQLENLPIYAKYEEEKLPKWKINYIQRNRVFWKKNKKYIKDFIPKIKKYNNSWQKLEWNAGDDNKRDIFEYLIQFRSSGIRVKKTDSVPSFVLALTQLPIIGWEKRYLSLEEAQDLQGFDPINTIDSLNRKYISALGNAVNTKVVEKIITQLV